MIRVLPPAPPPQCAFAVAALALAGVAGSFDSGASQRAAVTVARWSRHYTALANNIDEVMHSRRCNVRQRAYRVCDTRFVDPPKDPRTTWVLGNPARLSHPRLPRPEAGNPLRYRARLRALLFAPLGVLRNHGVRAGETCLQPDEDAPRKTRRSVADGSADEADFVPACATAWPSRRCCSLGPILDGFFQAAGGGARARARASGLALVPLVHPAIYMAARRLCPPAGAGGGLRAFQRRLP